MWKKQPLGAPGSVTTSTPESGIAFLYPSAFNAASHSSEVVIGEYPGSLQEDAELVKTEKGMRFAHARALVRDGWSGRKKRGGRVGEGLAGASQMRAGARDASLA